MGSNKLIIAIVGIIVVGVVAISIYLLGGDPLDDGTLGETRQDEEEAETIVTDTIDDQVTPRKETIAPTVIPEETEPEEEDTEKPAEEVLDYSMTGRVVDDATSQPIEGATVEAFYISYITRDAEGEPERRLDRTGEKAKTDEKGEFALTHRWDGRYYLTATHPEYSPSSVDAVPGNTTVEIRLTRGYRIYGTVLDDESKGIAGVAITVKRLDTSLVGPFLTVDTGQYQTNPMPPGWVFVIARQQQKNDSEDGPAPTFTSEKKWVHIENNDVEVDFGPSPDHITWRGTFYGWDGEPVPGGKLRVWNGDREGSLRFSRKTESTVTRRCTCDEAGGFELRKLVPGTYKVDMYLPGVWRMDHEGALDHVTFTKPGLQIRDVYMRRTELSGVILDGETGKPLDAEGIHVSLHNTATMGYYSRRLDENSRFCFRGLPPGTYTMQASGADVAAKSCGRYELAENQVIDDIEIVMPVNGTLEVEVTGLQNFGTMDIELQVFTADRDPKWTVSPGVYSSDGTWTIDFAHEVGDWIMILHDPLIGMFEKTYSVSRGKTTRIECNVRDFRRN